MTSSDTPAVCSPTARCKSADVSTGICNTCNDGTYFTSGNTSPKVCSTSNYCLSASNADGVCASC